MRLDRFTTTQVGVLVAALVITTVLWRFPFKKAQKKKKLKKLKRFTSDPADGELPQSFSSFVAEHVLNHSKVLHIESTAHLRQMAIAYLRTDINSFASSALFNSDTDNGNGNSLRNEKKLKRIIYLVDDMFRQYSSTNWDQVERLILANRDEINRTSDTGNKPGIEEEQLSAGKEKGKESERHDRHYKRTVADVWKKAVAKTITENLKKKNNTRRRVSQMVHTLREAEAVSSKSNNGNSNERQPVIIFLGGGMAAGKSALRKRLLDSFESQAVTVEADQEKMNDVVFKELSRISFASTMASWLMHEDAVNLAEQKLVDAVNKRMDILMDGTFTWAPFVEQTIDMLRNSHRYKYKKGKGYQTYPDGTISEEYWVQVAPHEDRKERKPYRIELYGVTAAPELAVSRGINRALVEERAVPIEGQLRSHALFAVVFPRFSSLVDAARLFHTGELLSLFGKDESDTAGQLTAIAHRESERYESFLVDQEYFEWFKGLSELNCRATCVEELYPNIGWLKKQWMSYHKKRKLQKLSKLLAEEMNLV